MTEAELMEAVWDDPDCPVALVGANALHPGRAPIPWPRERLTIPPGGALDRGVNRWVWRHRCPCRAPRHRLTPPEEVALAERLHWPAVELVGRVWVENSDAPRTWIVFLGQCGDCGRIYWAVG